MFSIVAKLNDGNETKLFAESEGVKGATAGFACSSAPLKSQTKPTKQMKASM